MQWTEYKKELRVSLIVLLILVIMVCGVYPLAVWGLGQVLFPEQANGSLVREGGRIVGSSLISQGFSGPAHFHPRPSAAGQGYDAANSGGSNLGPTSQKLFDAVKERIANYRLENGLPARAAVPADAVTASASGLDPHISIENALLQASRVAKARGLPEKTLRKKIRARTEGRDLGVLGAPRVNVLMLNADLDGRR